MPTIYCFTFTQACYITASLSPRAAPQSWFLPIFWPHSPIYFYLLYNTMLTSVPQPQTMLPRYLEIPPVYFYWMCSIFQESTQQPEIFTTSCSEITPSQISKTVKFIHSPGSCMYPFQCKYLSKQSAVHEMPCKFKGKCVNRAVFRVARSNIVMRFLNLMKFKLDLESQNRSQKKGWLGSEIVHIDWKYPEA